MEKPNTNAPGIDDGAADEYANTPVPESAKSVGSLSIFGVMLGVTTALIWFSLGAQLVHSFGTIPFVIGATTAALIVGGVGYIWIKFASQTGFNSDLVTRTSGFGYLGSTITALIFALNNMLYFAFEGGIMINAIHAFAPDIPLLVLQIATGLVFIPLTWFGVRFVSKLMWATLPVLVLFLVLIILEAANRPQPASFWSYMPATLNESAGSSVLQVMVAMFGIAGTIAVATDFGRFVPARRARTGAVLLGPVFNLVTFLLPLLLGAWLGSVFGENDPAVYFVGLFGAWGLFFVIITQARINVNNVYSIAIQFSNVAQRLFGITLSRGSWVTITCVLCAFTLTADLYSKAASVLGIWGIVIIAWIGTVGADLLINRKILRITPAGIGYSREHLYNFNPVGPISLVLSLVIAAPLSFGIAGPFGASLAPLAAFATAIITTPLAAFITKGRYYLRTEPHNNHAPNEAAAAAPVKTH